MLRGRTAVEVVLSTLWLWFFTSLLAAPLPPADRVRIAEAARLVQELGDRLWPARPLHRCGSCSLGIQPSFWSDTMPAGRASRPPAIRSWDIQSGLGRAVFLPPCSRRFQWEGCPRLLWVPERTGLSSSRW